MSGDDLPAASNEIEAEYVAMMRDLAKHLSELFPDSGFALLVFPFNGGGRTNWISNASREDMIPALKEFVSVLEEACAQPRGRNLQ